MNSFKDIEQSMSPSSEETTALAGESNSTRSSLSSSRSNADASDGGHDQQQQQQRRPITVLPQHVVDQIAAGEVVQRPMSVVKELLENSLDAGATHIVVHVEGGGLTKLSIADNGCGIHKSDLPLLATRHATSKLVTVDDLSSITSFGFRGEALASTSMVSRLLTVTTRTADSDVAYSMSYQNGKPSCCHQRDQNHNDDADTEGTTTQNYEPKTCARTVGTTIVVHDLFFNVLHRQKAYSKRESEEYAKILTIVQMYAIHYPTVGFVCQRTATSKASNNSKRGGITSSNNNNNKRKSPSSSSSPSIVVDCNTSQIQAVKAVLQSKERSSKRQRTTMSGSEPPEGTDKDQLIEATKQVISHVLEANVSQHLLFMECSSSSSLPSSASPTEDGNGKWSSLQPTIPPGGTSAETTATPSSSLVCQYTAGVYFSSPSYNTATLKQPKGVTTTTTTTTTSHNSNTNNKFVLFLNHRLVDLPPLKRTLEDVYANFGSGTNGASSSVARAKPVLVVDIHVPGSQVDVNVHPSKRQVALMFQEDVIDGITQQLRQRLEEHGQSFVVQKGIVDGASAAATQGLRSNPYTKTASVATTAIRADDTTTNKKRKSTASSRQIQHERDDDDYHDEDEESSPNQNRKESTSSSVPRGGDLSTASNKNGHKTNNDNKRPKPLPPSQFVRTNSAAPAGAIEPFLVPTQTQSQKYQEGIQLSQSSTENQGGGETLTTPENTDATSAFACPEEKKQDTDSSVPPPSLWPASIDMSQPGAFAKALALQESTDNPPPMESVRRSTIVKQPVVVRPKRVVPTQCSYTSIISLRKRVHKQQCPETTTQLRKAFFLGVVSHQRSLLQCGEELVMINHMELSRELFYQLALARFGGGATVARFGFGGGCGGGGGKGGIHIHTAIAQALQWEDDLIQREEKGETIESILLQQQRQQQRYDKNTTSSTLLDVNETNYNLAQQATACLLESADMLSEYFSICIEKEVATNIEDDKTTAGTNNRRGQDGNIDGDNDDYDDDDNVNDVLDAVLTGLPVLLDGHCPPPHGLPIFLLRLATLVDWTEERPCFHGICKELANFYAMLPLSSSMGEEGGGSDGGVSGMPEHGSRQESSATNGRTKKDTTTSSSSLNSYVQHGLFPALSYLLLPSKHLTENGHYSPMTKLSTLYKVFERC